MKDNFDVKKWKESRSRVAFLSQRTLDIQDEKTKLEWIEYGLTHYMSSSPNSESWETATDDVVHTASNYMVFNMEEIIPAIKLLRPHFLVCIGMDTEKELIEKHLAKEGLVDYGNDVYFHGGYNLLLMYVPAHFEAFSCRELAQMVANYYHRQTRSTIISIRYRQELLSSYQDATQALHRAASATRHGQGKAGRPGPETETELQPLYRNQDAAEDAHRCSECAAVPDRSFDVSPQQYGTDGSHCWQTWQQHRMEERKKT